MRCDPRQFAPVALAIALGTASLVVPTTHARADEISAEFKRGVEAYRAGNTADAIHIWEAVYGQAGEKRGYRVAFNLGRAYGALGDDTRAAEFYEAFLAQMDILHAGAGAGAIDPKAAPIEANVLKEEGEARRELGALQAKNGRLHVPAVERSLTVKVDAAPPRVAGFTMYVAPGTHSVAFDVGAKNETSRTVEAKAGQITEVMPPPAPEPEPAPPAVPAVVAPPPPVAPPPAAVTPVTVRVTEHPFSPVVLYIAGGVTLVSILVPVLTYAHVDSVHDSATSSQLADAKFRSDYDSTKGTAYATLAVPLGLAAVTGALTAWYLLGTRERDVSTSPSVTPTAAIAPGLATIGATGRF